MQPSICLLSSRAASEPREVVKSHNRGIGPSEPEMVTLTFLVQWLGLGALTTRVWDLLPNWRAEIPEGSWCCQKKRKKELLWRLAVMKTLFDVRF